VPFFETSAHLEYFCTNNQAKYEAILLSSMGVKHVETFSDSLLVVQQVADVYQCFDGSLNAYLDKCLKIIALLDDFTVHHVSRDENTVANDLAQQASSFRSNREKFNVLKKSDVLIFGPCALQKFVLLNQIQQNRMVRFQKPEGPEFLGTQTIQVK
jgi:hypothetical protein